MEERGFGEEKVFRYKIGEKYFVQKEMVLGQTQILTGLLKNLNLPERFDMLLIIEALSEIMPKACAVVLIDESYNGLLKDRDLNSVAAYFEENLNTSTTIKVLDDFFVCNPTASVLERVREMLVTRSVITETKQSEIGSTDLSSTLQEETSLNEMQSSGVTPSESVPPSQNIDSENISSEKL